VSAAVERLLQWLDDFDDLRDLVRLQARPVMVTLVLLVAFLTLLGVAFVVGPLDLHAAP
jgi:hypothetical protein